jgi:predicted nucleotidyltransferase
MAGSVRLRGGEAREAARRAAELLSADRRVQLVYLFGSAADEGRAEVRDVDLAVLSEPALSLDELMRLRADAVAAAGGLPIDLVSLNDAPVVLAHEVADAGRCLYARSHDAETEFVIRARARYWDFKPFLEEQWRLTGERLEERRRRGSTP